MTLFEDVLFWSSYCNLAPYEEDGLLIYRSEYDNFRSFIDQDKMDKELKSSSLHRLNTYIAKNVDAWKNKKLAVGVTGNSGTGKSSLINALRGLKASDEGAAKVGIKETTKTVQAYAYPGHNRIVLHDFPGVGTRNFPKENYLQKTKVLDSHVIILVSSSRFTENDLWLAKEAIKNKRNVLFVRTKVDIDLDSSEHDFPTRFDEDSCLENMREGMETNMKRGEIQIKDMRDVIYLVSSRRRVYDFDRLVNKINCLLDIEKSAICHFLYKHMEKKIAIKTKNTERGFVGRKVASALIGFLPIPMLETTLDAYHVKAMFDECQKKYNIDEESLKMFADQLNMSVKDLKVKLKSYSEEARDGERLYTETQNNTWGFVLTYSKYILPVVGSIISLYTSPCTIQECLKQICCIMANDKLMLVKLRIKKLKEDLRK